MTDRPRSILAASARMPGCCGALAVCAVVLLFGSVSVVAEEPAPQAIAVEDVASLEKALAACAEQESAIGARRAYKRVIREAEGILSAAPEVPNRYEVLAIIFQAQKRLLSLEPDARHRDAIFDTCRKLVDAPDDYAELRFEADMLLSEKALAERNATLEQRAEALQVMLDRYRGTPGEWQSLKIGLYIAPKLLAFDLEQAIEARIAERFGANHEAIAFRHKQTKVGELDVVFSGRYERVEGSPLVFPDDRLGHQYLVVFWTKTAPDHQAFLSKVKHQAERFPGRFEVYSFNLDELPDAGRQILESVGLDATAMRLPGGKAHSAYRAYARMNLVALLVNGQGHVRVQPGTSVPWPGPTPARGNRPASEGPGIGLYLDDDRYLAQLRSLFIGDFLVTQAASQDSPMASDLKAIDACFTRPPRRYRLTQEQSRADYQKAEALCSAAIRKHSQTPEIWKFRNRRMIALLGMWNLAREPAHLETAAEEAKRVLALDLPRGADVAARFCLAKQALRDRQADPEKRLAELIEKAGGDRAPATVLAAATVLALQANARTAYQDYRQQLLQDNGEAKPNLQPVQAFLRDKHHQYRNFWATPGGNGYERPQKYLFRDMVSGLSEPPDHKHRPQFELIGLDGQAIEIPQVAAGKMLGLVFIEPPADKDAAKQLMDRTSEFVKDYTDRGVDVIVAVIADDAQAVRSLLDQRDIDYPIGRLADGLDNPLVQTLGILSADRVPNLFLLRPDGSIAWGISGLRYHTFGNLEYALSLGIESNIEKVRSDAAFEALENHAYDRALKLFAEHLPPAKKLDWWAADRLQGRALAYIGLGDWAAALTEIDAAIDQRKSDFKGGICKCHGLVEMYLTKAMILDKLGRETEADAQRQRADRERTPHAKLPPGVARQGVPVGVYYDWLKQIRFALQEEVQTQ